MKFFAHLATDGWVGWLKVKTKGFIKPLALGRIGGQREKVKTKGFIKPLAFRGSIGFEFARGGEG
jgi:hypothetical protein